MSRTREFRKRSNPRKRRFEVVESNPVKRPFVWPVIGAWSRRNLLKESWPVYDEMMEKGGLTDAFYEIEARCKDACPYERDKIKNDILMRVSLENGLIPRSR